MKKICQNVLYVVLLKWIGDLFQKRIRIIELKNTNETKEDLQTEYFQNALNDIANHEYIKNISSFKEDLKEVIGKVFKSQNVNLIVFTKCDNQYMMFTNPHYTFSRITGKAKIDVVKE